MATARLQFTAFGGGLWLAGPPESNPPTTLRQLQAVHSLKASSLKSRPGSTRLYTEAAHSATRFADTRVRGVGTTLHQDGSVRAAGLSGNPLNFVAAPPTPGIDDYLFLIDGFTTPLKMSAAGAITRWGINPPTTASTAVKAMQKSKTIHAGEALLDATSGLTAAIVQGCNALGNDATYKTTGTKSLVISSTALAAGATERISEIELTGATLDLTVVSGVTSPEEDWIQVAIRFEHPRWIESVQFVFGSDTAYNASFSKEIIMDDTVAQKRRRGQKRKGLADLPGVANNDATFLANSTTEPFRIKAAELLGEATVHSEDNVWAVLQIPKTAFVENGTPNWASIVAIKVSIRLNTRATVSTAIYLDNWLLVGGVGLQGTYQTKWTFKNSTTGSRSNAGPAVEVEDVQRQGISHTNIPVSTDAQVDFVEGWRTLGNGVRFFKALEVANGVTTVTDEVADYAGLHQAATAVLQTEELPTDNTVPEANFHVAVFHQSRIFWISFADGAKGRVYYSPSGRVESVQGFIDVTENDDPTKRLVKWNGSLWCFTESAVFEIVGTDEPFLARKVFGVPGATRRGPIAASTYGIAYWSTDGVRLFRGASAPLVSDTLGRLFAGEAVDDRLAFTPTNAVTGPREEIWFTDQSRCLVFDPATETWSREESTGFTAMAFEPDTGNFLVNTGTKTLLWEVDGEVTDDGVAIPFAVRTPEPNAPLERRGLVQRLYVDCHTHGQILTPTAHIGGTTAAGIEFLDDVALPAITTTSRRTIEIPIGRAADRFGVSLVGSLTDAVEIFSIEADFYAPG